MEASWVPLYTRLATLPPGRAPGSVAAELDAWIRERRPLSEEQIVVYVRKLRKFSQNACALECGFLEYSVLLEPLEEMNVLVYKAILVSEGSVPLGPLEEINIMLMDWMEARGAKLNPRHHALRLDLVSKVNGIQAAEEYFWSLPDIFKSVKTYSSMLNCYAEHRMADKGLELYEKMKAMNFVLSITESYVTVDDLESAERVLEELQEVTPVHWSLYTMMVNNYIKVGQFGKVEVALQKAEEVMDKGEMPPWHYLLSLYARSGHSSEVKRIWESLKFAFKKCSNRSYLVMLLALRTVDDFGSLQSIFQEWQSSHQYYDMRIANVMITAYLEKGMIDEAEAIRQSAMAQGHCKDKTVYIFAESYLDKSMVKEALEILRDGQNMVRTHKWVPSKKLVNRFLKHYEEAKDVDGMESLCECLKKLECLDAEVYEALMRTYISAGRTNPSIAQRIEDDGIHIEPEIAKLLKTVSGS